MKPLRLNLIFVIVILIIGNISCDQDSDLLDIDNNDLLDSSDIIERSSPKRRLFAELLDDHFIHSGYDIHLSDAYLRGYRTTDKNLGSVMCSGNLWSVQNYHFHEHDNWCCFNDDCEVFCAKTGCADKESMLCATVVMHYFGILVPKKMCVHKKYCNQKRKYNGGSIKVAFTCDNGPREKDE